MKKTGFTEEQMVSVQSVSNRWLYSLLYFCGWLAAAGAYISVMYCLIMRRVEKRGALERMAFSSCSGSLPDSESVGNDTQ